MDDLKALVGELVQLNDDNLARAVVDSNDVQLRLSELWDMLNTDFVPVVRCKNCVHYDLGVCLKIYSDGNARPEAWQPRRLEDFCSYGERKEKVYES